MVFNMGKDKKKLNKHKRSRSNKKHQQIKGKRQKSITNAKVINKDGETERETKIPSNEESGEFLIPIALMDNKSHAPETQKEFERRQSIIRRVKDPLTGRVRLIKGESEVLEEIVTRKRHADINQASTRADGEYFRNNTVGKKKAHD